MPRLVVSKELVTRVRWQARKRDHTQPPAATALTFDGRRRLSAHHSVTSRQSEIDDIAHRHSVPLRAGCDADDVRLGGGV
jgi:hypothetical protein